METFNRNLYYLKMASNHAKAHSGCIKVVVGSAIIDVHQRVICGANRVMPDACTSERLSDNLSYAGYCNKLSPVDGNWHCVSTIHSEIDAIIKAARSLFGATIYVTRYPCENCARAIVAAGISKVVYGRSQPISDDTKRIFEWGKVEVVHELDYAELDSI